jgi:tetratricopeptide (TPR) repeat protein
MRKRLGEPLKSLRSFNKPLLAKETGSLDALKAYTEAHELGMAGKFQESVPLFKRAIELDPRFAIAYSDLGVVYSNLGEPGLATAVTQKAFELRDLADEPDRLFITARYHTQVTGDVNETIRTYETWTEMYAHQSAPWANLANAQTQIGRQDLSIEPAKRALAIDPKNAAAYVILARAQFETGRLDEALATCHQAIVQKIDGTEIHGFLFQIAFAQHDRTALNEQIAWAKGTPSEPYSNLQQMLMAFSQGQPKAALELFAQLTDGYRKRGMEERAKRMRGGLPRLEAELGMTDAARKMLQDYPLIDGSTDMPVALAEVGDSEKAETILREDLKKFPADTLWQYVYGPEIEAAISLSRNKPEEAVEALRRAVPYDLRSPELRTMRGRAYTAAGQYALAEAEFRKVIDQPTATLEPLMANLALAHLGLTRALALEGNVAVSRQEYEKVFDLWKDAEPDLPALRLAKAEYAALAHTGPLISSRPNNAPGSRISRF